jgi:hypothetical protein
VIAGLFGGVGVRHGGWNGGGFEGQSLRVGMRGRRGCVVFGGCGWIGLLVGGGLRDGCRGVGGRLVRLLSTRRGFKLGGEDEKDTLSLALVLSLEGLES